MAQKDDIQELDENWARVQIDSVDITNGDFIIVSHGNNFASFSESDIEPTSEAGAAIVRKVADVVVASLGVGDFFYGKTSAGKLLVGIAPQD